MSDQKVNPLKSALSIVFQSSRFELKSLLEGPSPVPLKPQKVKFVRLLKLKRNI